MYSILEVSDDTDALGPELITLEALKLELDITDDTDDEQLDASITRYSNLIAEYLDRRFGFANAVETFVFDQFEESRRGAVLALSLYPATIVSVVLNGSAVDEASYSFDPSNGFFRLLGGSWSGTIVVTYSGGYDLPEGAPAWLATAVIESIRLDRTASDRGDTAVSSVAHGDTRVSYFQQSNSDTGSGLASSVIDLLRPFRRPTFA